MWFLWFQQKWHWQNCIHISKEHGLFRLRPQFCKCSRMALWSSDEQRWSHICSFQENAANVCVIISAWLQLQSRCENQMKLNTMQTAVRQGIAMASLVVFHILRTWSAHPYASLDFLFNSSIVMPLVGQVKPHLSVPLWYRKYHGQAWHMTICVAD